MDPDDFFDTLQRPQSPNTWLVAPADFRIRPDAIAPVFDGPVVLMRDAFKSVALRSRGVALIEESNRGVHLIAVTPLMRFRDDVWALFIPVAEQRVTFALYSASRVGHWDLGTNRRRVTRWITQLQDSIAAARDRANLT